MDNTQFSPYPANRVRQIEMNTLRWFLLLYVFCVCTGACIARTVWRGAVTSQYSGRARQGRKLRTLERVMSRLSPSAVWQAMVNDKRATGGTAMSRGGRYRNDQDVAGRENIDFANVGKYRLIAHVYYEFTSS